MKQAKVFFAALAFVCLNSMIFGQVTNIFPNDGSAGIGTTSPMQKLHVHATNFGAIEVSGVAPGVIFSSSPTASLSTAAIGLATVANADHYLLGSAVGDLNMRGGVNKRLLFGTLNSAVGSGDIRMIINSNGQVGIGPGLLNDPFSKLHVEGSISSTKAIRTLSVKLDKANGRLKIRRYGEGDLVFKVALEPSSVAVGELLVNPGSTFTNGTRIKGSKLVVDGELGIGVSDTRGFKLAVKGKILAEELKIRTFANWPDYVFEDDYELLSLAELKTSIKETGHLPGLPSAGEVDKNGFNVGEVNAALLEKVEELTLYLIDLQEQVEQLQIENGQAPNENK